MYINKVGDVRTTDWSLAFNEHRSHLLGRIEWHAESQFVVSECAQTLVGFFLIQPRFTIGFSCLQHVFAHLFPVFGNRFGGKFCYHIV